jgi:hypothetical protein
LYDAHVVRSILSSSLVVAIASCASPRAQTVTLPEPLPSIAAMSPRPHVAQPATTGGNACLMLYECGCNAGCTRVDEPLDDLKPGMQVDVLSGPLAGSPVFVAKNITASGEPVLTVQRADPKAPIQVCANARTALVGYLCGMKESGAARACTTCE